MDEISTTIDTASNASMSRRTLIKGAAWAVPAVIVLGATPAYASSPPASPKISSVSLTGTRPADPPGKLVHFIWNFSAPLGVAILKFDFGTAYRFDLYATSAAINGTTVTFVGENQGGQEFNVPGFTATVTFTYEGNSYSETFSVSGVDYVGTSYVEFPVS